MLRSNKLSQVAVEFLMLIGLALFVFFVFIGVSLYYTNNLNKQRQQLLMDDLVLYVQRELKTAETVKDGYYRKFTIPDKVNNKDYGMLQQNNELLIGPSEYELDDNLILLLHLNGNADDSSRNNNNGNIIEANCDVEGKYNKGCNFDGINDHIILDNEANFDNGNNPFTIAAWINTNSTNFNKKIATKTDKTSAATGFEFMISYGIKGSIGIGKASFVKYSNNVNVNNGGWHYVVATYDGFGLATGYKAYKDGNEVSLPNSAGGFSPGSNNNKPVIIASSDYFSSTEYFNGIIDEIAMWNRTLSNNEIKQHYNEGKAIYTPDESKVTSIIKIPVVKGNLKKGDNTINKTRGVIYIN